ncbi:hypothetical protein LSAT2_018440 [Lamellibrachia satsuma]|nr:hypothetical protein LSAT2_018440 [Lamellibrachia satsuma]
MSVSQEPEIAKSNNMLPVDVYQDWISAIVSDNADQVDTILTAADESQRHLLLNGSFDYQDEEFVHHNPYRFSRPVKPLSLCALTGALRVMRVLVGHGVHMTFQDARGHNVVHQLIFVAFFDESYENCFIESYQEMMRLTDLQTKMRLLLMESNFGLRPLEAASQHGVLGFVQAIMETEGVYLSRQIVRGLSVYQWYDVTEYESFDVGNRRWVSPVRFLMTLDERKLKHSYVKQVYFDKPFGTWVSNKVSVNRPVILVWALLRLAHITAYYALDMSIVSPTSATEKTSNVSNIEDMSTTPEYRLCEFESPINLSKTPRRVLASYIIVHSVMILLWDIVERWRTRKCPLSSRMRKTIDGKRKKAVASSVFYVRCQQTLAVLFAIDATIKLADEESGWTVSGVRVVCMALSTWSLLYFVQLLPSIGYFVVAIQQMVRQMFNFSVVYSIFFYAAFHAFFVTVNTSERQSCSGEFSNMSQGIYSTFAIMLNLVNPAQLGLRHPGWFYVLHVVYMFNVAILLINFLIAIMSSALSEVALQRPIIERLQRLSIAIAIESRIDRLVAPYYCATQRRHFVYEDGRIYIVQVMSPRKYKDIIVAGKDTIVNSPEIFTNMGRI